MALQPAIWSADLGKYDHNVGHHPGVRVLLRTTQGGVCLFEISSKFLCMHLARRAGTLI